MAISGPICRWVKTCQNLLKNYIWRNTHPFTSCFQAYFRVSIGPFKDGWGGTQVLRRHGRALNLPSDFVTRLAGSGVQKMMVSGLFFIDAWIKSRVFSGFLRVSHVLMVNSPKFHKIRQLCCWNHECFIIFSTQTMVRLAVWVPYPLVNIQKTMENHHAISGKTHELSIVIFNFANC